MCINDKLYLKLLELELLFKIIKCEITGNPKGIGHEKQAVISIG